MRAIKRLQVFFLTLVLVFTLLPVQTIEATGKVKLNKTKVTAYIGSTLTLKITGTDKKVTWGSDNKKVATVNHKGKVTPKKTGKAIITAKVSGKKYKCTVTVKKPFINVTKKTLKVKDTYTLKLTGTSIRTVSTSNKKVATVSKKGVITAKSAGKATITLKGADKKSYKCKVTVNKPKTTHIHSYEKKLTKKPSCDEHGVMTYTCTCGDTYTEKTSKRDHCTDRSEVTKQPTCVEEGIETFYCIFCGREIYTEKIAKLPHREECNHESEETDIPTDPKDYTFTQDIKLLYVTGTTGLYAWPDKNSAPYAYLEIGTAVPVISKCDQADFYRTSWGRTVSGQNLSEERPVEYAPGEEGVWENFIEETDSKYTYWSGIYRVNGYELHSDRMNKSYVERHMEYAKQGLYTLMYRDIDSSLWSGCYEIMIEKNSYFNSSEYLDWIELYIESKGLKASTASEKTLLVYRSPKEENSEKLRVVSVSVGK